MSSPTAPFGIDVIPLRVREDVYAHVYSSPDAEVGGVLVGNVDGRSGVPRVVGSIRAQQAEESRASLTFTHETWSQIITEQDRDFPNAQIVGWYHSHPDFDVFLSEHDLFLHRNFFSSAHQFAYVVDPILGTEALFGWREGSIDEFFRGTVPLADESAPAPRGAPAMVVNEEDLLTRTFEVAAIADAAAGAAAVADSLGTDEPRRRIITVDDDDDQPRSRRGAMVAVAAAVLALAGAGGAVALTSGGSSSGPGTVTDSNPAARVGQAERDRLAAAASREKRTRDDAAGDALLDAIAATKYVKPVPPPSPGPGPVTTTQPGGNPTAPKPVSRSPGGGAPPPPPPPPSKPKPEPVVSGGGASD